MTLARTESAVLLASAGAVTLAGWLWLVRDSTSCHVGPVAASFVPALAMWLAMSVAMMTPTTLNWLSAYAKLTSGGGRTSRVRAVLTFLAGYFSVWLVYSAVAAAIQIELQRANWLTREGKLASIAGGLVLIAAGAVWFTPLSRACLKHCRNPMTYFASHWRNGPRGGFRFGVAHGTFCAGCCWLLMLTGFAMGVMNLVWMALLTILISVEKLAPRGERIAAVAAVGMIVWGIVLIA